MHTVKLPMNDPLCLFGHEPKNAGRLLRDRPAFIRDPAFVRTLVSPPPPRILHGYTGLRHNTGILISVYMLFLSVFIYLVCNFVVSHFPAGYDRTIRTLSTGRCDKRPSLIRNRRLLEPPARGVDRCGLGNYSHRQSPLRKIIRQKRLILFTTLVLLHIKMHSDLQ